MNVWNVGGELLMPKYITSGWNVLKHVLNATFHWLPSLIRMLLYWAPADIKFGEYPSVFNLLNEVWYEG